MTAATNDEVIAGAAMLIADGVDAIFTPTDNIIMAAELAIYENGVETNYCGIHTDKKFARGYYRFKKQKEGFNYEI